MKYYVILGCLVLALDGQHALAESETDENALPILKQATLYLKEDKDAEAQASFEKCLEFKLSAEHESLVRLYLGNLYSATDKDKAFEFFKKARELDPKNTNVLPSLGNAYAQRKDYKTARELLNEYLTKEPDAPNVDSVKKLLTSIDDVEKEGALVDKINGAIDLYNRKKYAEAAAILEETQKADDEHAKKHRALLAMCYSGMGNYKTAIEMFTVLLTEDPKQPKIVSALAGCYEGMGDLKQARETLKKYLHMSGGNAEIKQAAKDRMPVLKKVMKTAGSSEGSDYFHAVSTPYITRWSMTRMPLRVYFEPSNEVRNYQDSYATAVPRALDLWCKATDGRVSWKTVEEKRNADIEVRFTADPADVGKSESHSEAGVCESQSVRQKGAKIGGINHCVVKLLTTDHDGNPYSQEALEATAAHEIGHALGMREHSSNPNDVMFFAATKTVREGLTERDANTIKHVYNAVVYDDGRIEVPGREEAK
jgi:tetratricopeptide (TPR) repeat protein